MGFQELKGAERTLLVRRDGGRETQTEGRLEAVTFLELWPEVSPWCLGRVEKASF